MIAVYPQAEYRFAIHVNRERQTWQEIRRKTGCYAIVNLGTYHMATFQPSAGLIVDGAVIAPPIWRQYGLCIDSEGRASCDVESSPAGRRNYCIAQPPMVINGKPGATAKYYPENGTTMIGFRQDGALVALLIGKEAGINSTEAIRLMREQGCIHILRYDGSWSSQGSLGPGLDLQPKTKRIVHNYLLVFRRETGEKEEPMSIKTYSRAKDGNAKLSTHFRVKEFASKDGADTLLVDTQLIPILQAIRDHFALPVTINSGYRTEAHNQAVSGAKNSYHTKGMAADISVKGVAPLEVARFAQALGTRGIGLYGNFTHVDTRPKRYYWDRTSGKELPVATFAKDPCPYPEPTVNIRAGSRGEGAKWVQWQLNRLGTALTVDGVFGVKSAAALKAFQQKNGLAADGICGAKTRDKLRG